MIADLLRNDPGRIGSEVKVTRLLEVTGYKTLHQMTSSISAITQRKMPLYELFQALFPSGSVTGAPKIRATGYITPYRDMYFNVPIRTVLLQNGKGEMGIDSGIIWDSTAEGEWNEGMLKASFLTGNHP